MGIYEYFVKYSCITYSILLVCAVLTQKQQLPYSAD